MTVQLSLGLDIIRSYKRLAYTPWHALAEFVDNSTQSYFDNRDALDPLLRRDGNRLEVSIVYSKDDDLIRITDNAMGMSLEDLVRALKVGTPPKNPDGRSQYGMGLKTAACWFGDLWTIRTKKLGETVERRVTVDVERVAGGDSDLPFEEVHDRPVDDHFTTIEIRRLHRKLHGKTLGKIKDFLRSMYRHDIREGTLALFWQGQELVWDDIDNLLAVAPDGTRYKSEFEFEVDGKPVWGWVGVLERGSRARAGFSILRCGRVIRGWPDSWRPESLYGQLQGSNDLVNQRLIGEINLDHFPVSHTKDDILWFGDQEQAVEEALAEACRPYREVARTRRTADNDERGPNSLEIKAALEAFQDELESPELVDALKIERVPPPEAVSAAMEPLFRETTRGGLPGFSARVGDLDVLGFLANDASPNDPYVAVDATSTDKIQVVINMQHPHFTQIEGSQGVLNYLRHCVYDGVAEWQARHKAGRLDPETVKMLKDKLLRLACSIECPM